jgi:hypothetical protein
MFIDLPDGCCCGNPVSGQKNALNKQIIKQWIAKQNESNKRRTETNEIEQLMNNERLATNMNKYWFTEHKNWGLNCDCQIFARIKYLCDFIPNNCNPVCLGVSYEMSCCWFFCFSSWLTRGLLKNHRTPQQLWCFIPHTLVQYQLSSIIANILSQE